MKRKNEISRKHLCAWDSCTGCYACVNKCPRNAINMQVGFDGAIRPYIDENKCVNCGLCDKVCPSIEPVEVNLPRVVYAAYTDVVTRKQSASGGIATVLTKEFIKNGDVVYGAAQTTGIRVEHIRVTTDDDIKRIQGSKYVHSHLGNTINQVIDDLKAGRKVLFIGVPCQVAAVKKCVSDSYSNNLYTVDLICHGVPTWETLQKCMQRESGIDDLEDMSISFRDQDGYEIKIISKDKRIVYRGNLKNSYYYNGFMEGYIFRENCYSCKYANSKRVGDITLGDFWGLNIDKDFDGEIKDGINVVLVNTIQGQHLFSLAEKNIQYWQREFEEAIAGNGQLRSPSKKSVNQKAFSVLSRRLSADNAVFFCNLQKSAKLIIRKQIKKLGIDMFIGKVLPGAKSKL